MKDNTRMEWLSSLRGLAALLVILTHLLPYIEISYGQKIEVFQLVTVGIVDVGKIGVAIFFLISGYLTPSSYKKRSKLQFIINRFFRLYPVYWCSILLVGIIFRFDGASIKQILANITMLQVFMGQDDLIGVYWTMPIEILLYVFIGIFIKYLWNVNHLRIIYFICCIGTVCLGLIRKSLWGGCSSRNRFTDYDCVIRAYNSAWARKKRVE